MFRKSSIFSMLALAASIVGLQWWLHGHRPPLDLRPALVAVAWAPIAVEPLAGSRARLAGAWELRTSDPRIGGLSGVALERGRLLAISDSGMLARIPLPPGGGTASIRTLPAVAGDPLSKIGRDSEALAWDPRGRGWWVAFEQRHQLILYDRDFRAALTRLPVADSRFRRNRGIEALSAGASLRYYPESSGISDAANLPDGRRVLLVRGFGPGGFTARVAGLGDKPISVPVGPLDNAEGLAAQMLADGSVRLWIVTDNDGSRWRPTRLLALDVPQAAAAAD